MIELKSANLFRTGMLMPIVAVGAAVPVGATVVVGARAAETGDPETLL